MLAGRDEQQDEDGAQQQAPRGRRNVRRGRNLLVELAQDARREQREQDEHPREPARNPHARTARLTSARGLPPFPSARPRAMRGVLNAAPTRPRRSTTINPPRPSTRRKRATAITAARVGARPRARRSTALLASATRKMPSPHPVHETAPRRSS